MFWNVFFFWVCNQKLKTPSNGTCLGEPLGGFVILCIFIYFHLSMIFILLFYLHLISRLLFHVTGTPPWLLRPMKASTRSELYPDYPVFFFIYCEHYGFQWAFFTLFLNILTQPAFIKASVGAGNYSLKFAGLHTDPWNTDPVHLFVWFTVIHNLLYILNLYLCMLIMQTFYLWKLW